MQFKSMCGSIRIMKISGTALVGLSVPLAIVCPACSHDAAGGVAMERKLGNLGDACYDDGTCNAGLDCQADVCVQPSDGGVEVGCVDNSRCSDGRTCVAGVCILPVLDGENAACDEDGGCADGLECMAGVCCRDGKTVCGERCVDVSVDSENCGMCYRPCTPGELCIESECHLLCDGVECVHTGAWFTMLAAGGYHTCGILQSNDRVVCWGLNDHGQAPPKQSLDTFWWISAGEYHTCGIRKDDDKVVCWGLNDEGQAPSMASSETYRSLAAGWHHTCAVRRKDGKVDCWGRNADGQAPSTPPNEVFQVIAAGGDHTCGINEDSAIVCWGRNTVGQATPPAGIDYWRIGAGYDHTCAISSGGIVCWGSDNTEVPPAHPLSGYMQVGGGVGSTCYLTVYDTVPFCGPIWCKGNLVSPSSGDTARYFSSFSVGSYHGCGIYGSSYIGSAVGCWGSNSDGQAPQF